MKKVYFILISLILMLIGCSTNISTDPIIEEKQSDDFKLVINTDKGVYKTGETIEIESYLEYLGEEEIQLNQEPIITIIIRNKENGSIIKQVDFDNVKTTMEKGEKFSQNLVDFNLEKGEYELFVQMSPTTVGRTTYSLNTIPRILKVK
ncbi:hypothetical protein [Neobacillus sp. D3-1R]|uniref:hypothetical protein n=1 Tax=Neobacillus sp. D3-1R TaxID=3445778 RepID=UPI003FA0444F